MAAENASGAQDLSTEKALMRRTENGWHLDKRVPIAVLLVLFAQLVTVIFFFGQLSVRVDALESSGKKAEDAALALVRLDTTMTGLARDVDKIAKRVDQGILPYARFEIDALNKRLSSVEERLERQERDEGQVRVPRPLYD